MSDELIDRFIAGTASPGELEELRIRVNIDPRLMRRIYEAAERELELYDAFADAEVRAECLTGILSASATGAAAMLAIADDAELPESSTHGPRRLPITARLSRRPQRGELVRGALLAMAAGLVAVCAWQFVRVGQPDRRAPANRDSTTARSAPVAPPVAPHAGSHVDNVGHSDEAPTLNVSEKPVAVEPAPIDVASTAGLSAPVVASTPTPTVSAAPPVADSAATRRPASATASARPSAADGASLARLDRRLQRFDGDYKDAKSGAVVMRYSLRVPETLPEKRHLGLVLLFHGFGGSETNLVESMVAGMQGIGVAGDYVIVGGKSKGKGWTPEDDGAVLEFLAWLKRTYPIDPRRIFAVGVSNGAWMAGNFAVRHPEVFAGVATFAGGSFIVGKAANAADSQTEYYVVHGAKDKDVNVSNAHASRDALKAQGYHYVYREFPELGHTDVWNDPDARADIAGWMHSLRHKQVPLSDDDQRIIAQYNDSPDRLLAQPGGADELVRIGGIQAGKVVARGMRSKDPAARANAAEACGRTCFAGGATIPLLAAALDDKDAKVRQAALKALAAAADWHYAEAQLAVCRCAVAKARDKADRLFAVQCLAQSPWLTLVASDDALVFEALVHLLDDEDQALREAAFAPLAKLAADGFGYRADAMPAARHEAQGRWKMWYLEHFTAQP